MIDGEETGGCCGCLMVITFIVVWIVGLVTVIRYIL